MLAQLDLLIEVGFAPDPANTLTLSLTLSLSLSLSLDIRAVPERGHAQSTESASPAQLDPSIEASGQRVVAQVRKARRFLLRNT